MRRKEKNLKQNWLNNKANIKLSLHDFDFIAHYQTQLKFRQPELYKLPQENWEENKCLHLAWIRR